MSTINEIILEVENEIKEVYDTDKYRKEVIELITNLIWILNGKSIWGYPAKHFEFYSADELTRIWGKLAIYQYNLIEYESIAYKNMKITEAKIESKRPAIRTKIISDSEKKPSEADIKIKLESFLVKLNLLKEFHENEHNKLTAMKFSINSIIWRIESRIKYLLTDINNKFNNET